MCEPATAGLIISAIAGGASAKNNSDALKRQDREAARGIKNQADNQVEANRKINEQIQDIGANTGQAERDAALEDYQAALRAGQAGTEGSLPSTIGASSDRFAERSVAGRETLASEGGEQAERLSVIDGILRQRIGEGQQIGRTENALQGIRANVSGEDYLTRLRVAGQRANPWVGAGADALGGYGAGLSQRVPATG